MTWGLLLQGIPLRPTVYRWFAHLRDEAVFERMSHTMEVADRKRTRREAKPINRIRQICYTVRRHATLLVSPENSLSV